MVGKQFAQLSLCCLSLCSFATVHAQGFLDEDELRQSTWNSTYISAAGNAVQARIQFNGRTGTYDTNQGRGRLFNIDYGVDTTSDPNGESFFQIAGEWVFRGETGNFLFRGQGGKKFQGNWYGSNGSGRWTGQLAPAAALNGSGQVTYDRQWSYNPQKDYYYKKCSFSGGGHQYLIWCEDIPEWIFWYNPVKEVCWCACPTRLHPRWGRDIANGKDLFLLAIDKARSPRDTRLADDTPGNLKSGLTAKNAQGDDVALGCPPSDLP
jgi:hypothetical protein